MVDDTSLRVELEQSIACQFFLDRELATSQTSFLFIFIMLLKQLYFLGSLVNHFIHGLLMQLLKAYCALERNQRSHHFSNSFVIMFNIFFPFHKIFIMMIRLLLNYSKIRNIIKINRLKFIDQQPTKHNTLKTYLTLLKHHVDC